MKLNVSSLKQQYTEPVSYLCNEKYAGLISAIYAQHRLAVSLIDIMQISLWMNSNIHRVLIEKLFCSIFCHTCEMMGSADLVMPLVNLQ